MFSFTNTKVVPIKNGKAIKVEPYTFDINEPTKSLDEIEKLIKDIRESSLLVKN